jgi:HD-like signal output (HDOD) protein
MKRILFVDDEPNVLDSLRDAVRAYRREWCVAFAQSGAEALATLANETFDVVVSDMRMPGMDGATLLARVQAEHPATVRIVLSGYAEVEAALRAVAVAHVFLAKPCNAGELRDVIERACSLRALLGDGALLEVVGGAGVLPSVPDMYMALEGVLADPASGSLEVATVLERDVAMAAKLLQVVNSAFFGLGGSVTSVADAVSYLGIATVRSLVLTESAFAAFETGPQGSFSVAALRDHSELVARIARRIAEPSAAGEVWATSMLHDVGKLVLATRDPAAFARTVELSVAEDEPLVAVEERERGVTHAEAGAYLLSMWGLPEPIVAAVAHHHRPSRSGIRVLGPLGAVHIADVLARELGSSTPPPLDSDFLVACGVAERLHEWRAIAAAEYAR